MARRILITGAGIAGTTAAWWLGRAGFGVTVVERAPAFRDGGQNVDVRGCGRTVLRRMGLKQAALDHGTGERGTAWVEADGRIAAQFITSDLGADGPTAEMNPHSRIGIRLLHYAPAQASRPAIRGAVAKLFSGHANEPDLSRYQATYAPAMQ